MYLILLLSRSHLKPLFSRGFKMPVVNSFIGNSKSGPCCSKRMIIPDFILETPECNRIL